MLCRRQHTTTCPGRMAPSTIKQAIFLNCKVCRISMAEDMADAHVFQQKSVIPRGAIHKSQISAWAGRTPISFYAYLSSLFFYVFFCLCGWFPTSLHRNLGLVVSPPPIPRKARSYSNNFWLFPFFSLLFWSALMLHTVHTSALPYWLYPRGVLGDRTDATWEKCFCCRFCQENMYTL